MSNEISLSKKEILLNFRDKIESFNKINIPKIDRDINDIMLNFINNILNNYNDSDITDRLFLTEIYNTSSLMRTAYMFGGSETGTIYYCVIEKIYELYEEILPK